MRATNLIELADGLVTRAERPALVTFAARERPQWSYRHLAGTVRELAKGLIAAGLEPGDRVALFAPDGPEWIAAALAVIRAGTVVTPLDAQFTDDSLAHTLTDSAARLVFTTVDRAARAARLAPAARIVLLDTPEGGASWRELRGHGGSLPERRDADPAALFYTSGTTGPPKGVPLSHGNLAFQVNTLTAVRLVTSGDRVCLPLPLHHVYPFVMGLLTPLALGLPIVLPPALTGPQIVRALKEGEVTVLVGVPRLYSALLSAMELELARRGRWVAAAVGRALDISIWGRRRLGVRWGEPVFRGLRARIGPRLRLLTSGGAALEPTVAWKLEGLGWELATGYGLTETSPMLTLNLPGSGRPDSAGRPIPGVALRFAPPARQERGEGEIQVRSAGVFAGYLNLPDKTREAFTDDGWFRTGDLGYLDAEGFLHITGRADEMLVTPGGENLNPESIEAVFLRHAFLRDFAVLQQDGRLVGLALPDVATIERAGRADVLQAVREAVAEINPTLPSYQRVGEVAVTRDPLPRNRLGKLRRRGLPSLYTGARASTGEQSQGPIALTDMVEADRLLLENEPAKLIWEWLAQRYRGRRLTMDVSLSLDLGVDSLEWLGLTLEIERRAGVQLDEVAIARVATIRDLLRAVAEAPRSGVSSSGMPWDEPERLLSPAQARWLAPLGPGLTLVSRSLMAVNGWLMRLLFRLRTVGLDHLPDGPWVLTPNHTSFLDPLALSAALGRRWLERTYWGGWTGVAFANPVMRGVSRLWRVLPIDQARGAGSSLALAATVLKQGQCLVWFPEGERSRSGQLLPFRPGIGLLLARFPRPVVPVSIRGTFHALPRGKRWVTPRPVTVTFGLPLDPQRLVAPGASPEEAARRIVQGLEAAVADLGRRTERGDSSPSESQPR
ncbi:MAG TPA: AMP-binding protein [Methylomirabilota bacterium]|nr:AMP-binding protein [Methylomirabilota bacterium]